jgi:antitoxin HicB
MARYSVVLIPEPEEGGYSVIVPLLPGCYTQGETRAEALANVRKAIAGHLEALAGSGEEAPEELRPLILERVEVDPEPPGHTVAAEQRSP